MRVNKLILNETRFIFIHKQQSSALKAKEAISKHETTPSIDNYSLTNRLVTRVVSV